MMALSIDGEPASNFVRQQRRPTVLQNGFRRIGDETAVLAQGEDAIEGLIRRDRAGVGRQSLIGRIDIHHHAAKGVVAVAHDMADGEPVEEKADMAESEGMPEGEEEPESADLREQVARLTVQLAGHEADREIAKLRERSALDDKAAAKARSLYMRDRDAFRLFAEALPERPKATPRIAGASPDKSISLAERASQIQKAKGVAFKDACQIALAEGYTRTEG